MQYDFTNAELWFSMCRDYNPKLTECGLTLTKLYYTYGSFNLAMDEVEKILKGGTSERIMLNFFNQWNCDVPLVAFKLFAHLLRIHAPPSERVVAGDAIYLLLLRTMIQDEKCGFSEEEMKAPDGVMDTVEGLLRRLPPSNGVTLTVQSSRSELCSSAHTARYLLSKEYKLHPCELIAEQANTIEVCKDFTAFLPPPSEEYQTRDRKAFIGSASLPDIVHHVYAGNSRRLQPPGRPFRVLFAEYFHPRSVYSLVGQMISLELYNFEIVVVVPQTVVVPNTAGPAGAEQYVTLATQMRNALYACRDPSKPVIRVDIIEETISDYFSALMSAKLSAINKGTYDPKKFTFDFIEYNGGMSLNPLYREHLNMISQVSTG
jgi:hypothetical protein